MKRLAWYLKQLFPLLYRTVYASDGRVIYHTWKMWMGTCYDEEWVMVCTEVSPNLRASVAWLSGVNSEKGPVVPGDLELPPHLIENPAS